MGGGKYPIEQRIEDKKRGIGRQKYPFVGEVSNAVCPTPIPTSRQCGS